MESQYRSHSPSRTISKKTILFGVIAAIAFIGLFCVLNVEFIELRFFRYKGQVGKAWDNWKVQHNRTYGNPEDKIRFNVFKQNYQYIQGHNAKNLSYTLGLNKFADLTNKEFAALYTGASSKFKKGSDNCETPPDVSRLRLKLGDLPSCLNWTAEGRVGPAKDQQQCGSCWAFSTTGALEGLASQSGPVPSFSEQQLVDCSTDYGNQGCDGGWVQNAFHYVIDKGITTEDAYPYTGEDGTCQESNITIAFQINDCANVEVQSVEALQQALQNGPVSVYVEADQNSFQLYTGGVVTDINCFSAGETDHAVLAVGYTEDAWIVKNSWGTSWGENGGYIRISTDISADSNGICGILSTPNTYPVSMGQKLP